MALKGQAQIFGINYLWTNTAGGDFNVAANWSPNGVPGVNDGAIIANIGNFTVHLNTSAAIAGLTLGGSTLMYGRQTLSITNPAAIFTVGGDMLIDRSGVLSFSGSAISCPSNSTVNGIFNVMSGSIGSTNAASGLVTVTTNGAWSLIGVATLYEPVANYGTVVLTNGGSLNLGRSSTFPVAFTNELNALVDIQNDQAISFASGVPNPPSTAGIYNYGLLRKSVGATNSATSIRVPFHNNGTIQPLAGDLVFSGGLSLSSSSDLQFLMAAAKPGMMTLASPAPATNSPPTLPTLGSPS
ncbi:MAG: hypothetical protein ACREDQ_14020, partial [Limisphaerales bacterium]